MTIGLEFEEMRLAARTLSEGIAPVETILTGLSDTVAVASAGFRGQAAAGLGEALTAWFDVAATLGPVLDGYAQAIMQTANTHRLNDTAQAEEMDRLTQRLGGGPR